MNNVCRRRFRRDFAFLSGNDLFNEGKNVGIMKLFIKTTLKTSDESSFWESYNKTSFKSIEPLSIAFRENSLILCTDTVDFASNTKSRNSEATCIISIIWSEFFDPLPDVSERPSVLQIIYKHDSMSFVSRIEHRS
jgi:hypothetical protein